MCVCVSVYSWIACPDCQCARLKCWFSFIINAINMALHWRWQPPSFRFNFSNNFNIHTSAMTNWVPNWLTERLVDCFDWQSMAWRCRRSSSATVINNWMGALLSKAGKQVILTPTFCAAYLFLYIYVCVRVCKYMANQIYVYRLTGVAGIRCFGSSGDECRWLVDPLCVSSFLL